MITIQRLDTVASIEEACSLLYQVYIQQQKWQFAADNPSGIHTEIRNNKRVLVDRFVERAVWFGAFDNDKLVGCVRLFSVDENNNLEVETYPSSQPIHALIPHDEKNKCYDITRLAVSASYVGRGVVKRLFLACFRFCQEHQYHALAFTHNGYLKALFKKIEFPLNKEQAFKYESQDSSPVNFYFADYKKSEVNEVQKKLEYLENDLSNNARSIFKALHIVEQILPTPFYWMNAQGVVLGINELCLRAIGATRDIIGKQPYEFYNTDSAEHILKHNAEVISKGEILTQEEWIEDVTTKVKKCFSSIKAPLYDDEGTIIGIVGTSIEITAQKEAQAKLLKLESERQLAALEEKEKFVMVARKVAHDINSPLASLNMMMGACTELPEEARSVMTRAVESVLDIANNLLSTYKKDEERGRSETEQHQPVLTSDLLSHLLSEKRIQFVDRPIQFKNIIGPAAQFAFAQLQPSQFQRAMSNLINNAVDALGCKSGGMVIVRLSADANSIIVSIEDNGKGMPAALTEKILTRQSFTSGKRDGHGLGLQQVWDTLDNNEGSIRVESMPGKGTVIQLTFPRVAEASWLAHSIRLRSDSIIVILDDDESIHDAWDARFKPLMETHRSLQMHHFTHGINALDFINALFTHDRSRAVFLSDFELLKQDQNGLQIIAEGQIQNSTLVTSYYANQDIRDQAAEMGIKILPKQMASVIPVDFEIVQELASTAS